MTRRIGSIEYFGTITGRFTRTPPLKTGSQPTQLTDTENLGARLEKHGVEIKDIDWSEIEKRLAAAGFSIKEVTRALNLSAIRATRLADNLSSSLQRMRDIDNPPPKPGTPEYKHRNRPTQPNPRRFRG